MSSKSSGKTQKRALEGEDYASSKLLCSSATCIVRKHLLEEPLPLQRCPLLLPWDRKTDYSSPLCSNVGICLNSVTIISCQLPSKGVVPAVQICISQTCNHAGKRQHICIAIPALPGTRLVSIKHMSSVFNSLLTQSKLILLLFFPLWLYQ